MHPRSEETTWFRVRAVIGRLDRWAYASGLRSMARLTLPDWLGIGAQKAGTTWLDRMLRHHPELYLPERKELHYWDWHRNRSLRAYSTWFHDAGGRKKGEITPSYSVLPRTEIAVIARLLPRVRLLLLLRDPVERAWSSACGHLAQRRDRRVEDVSESEFLAHFEREGPRARGMYARILDNWLSAFPRTQLWVGLTDDLVTRPQGLLQEVFDHLGVSQAVDERVFPAEQVVFRGTGAPLPHRWRAHLLETYAADLRRLHARLGSTIERWSSVKEILSRNP